MSDLHEARDPERDTQNDTSGWLLWVIAVAIITVATMAAYKPHDMTVANLVSQIVVR